MVGVPAAVLEDGEQHAARRGQRRQLAGVGGRRRRAACRRRPPASRPQRLAAPARRARRSATRAPRGRSRRRAATARRRSRRPATPGFSARAVAARSALPVTTWVTRSPSTCAEQRGVEVPARPCRSRPGRRAVCTLSLAPRGRAVCVPWPGERAADGARRAGAYEEAWDEQRRVHAARVAGDRARHRAAAGAPAGLHRGQAHPRPRAAASTARRSSTSTAAARSPGTARASSSATRSSRCPSRSTWSRYVRRRRGGADPGLRRPRRRGRPGSRAGPASGSSARRRAGPQGRRDRHPGLAGRDDARLRAQLRLRPHAGSTGSCRAASPTPRVTSLTERDRPRR